MRDERPGRGAPGNRVQRRPFDLAKAAGPYQAKLQTARFYFARLFPETAMLMRTARSGVANLLDTDAALA